MLNSPCMRCSVKEKCEQVGIKLEELQKLIFLSTHDATDLFALGMAEFTLKSRSGNFEHFRAVLTEEAYNRQCSFQ